MLIISYKHLSRQIIQKRTKK